MPIWTFSIQFSLPNIQFHSKSQQTAKTSPRRQLSKQLRKEIRLMIQAKGPVRLRREFNEKIIWLATLTTLLTLTSGKDLYEGMLRGQEAIYRSIHPCSSMALIDSLVVLRRTPRQDIIWIQAPTETSHFYEQSHTCMSKSAWMGLG